MKKLMICLLALLLLTGAAMAEVARKGDLISAGVEADFPGWQLVGESTYGSGRWEGEPAHHCEVFLMQVEGGFLRFRRLHVIMNPIEPGDPVPWEVTDYAPVPLSAEAEARLAAMKPADVLEGWKFLLREDALPGSAEFLLREGETLSELTGFADILVVLVKDGEGRMGLRIGHWDGTQYTRVTATAMSRYVGINEIHSHNTGLEMYVDDDKQLWVIPSTEEPDAPWQVGIVFAHDEEGYDGGSYVIGADFLCTYDTYAYRFFEDCQHNDGFRYGTPTFPVLLDGLDLSGIPANLEAATELLDATGYACTKADGVPLYDAPEGTVLGSAYARLVGRVVSEQDGWVELRIGDEARGMTAFFRAEDLAYAGEVNRLLCGFPSFDTAADWDAEQAMPGVTEALAGDRLWGMQLIARAADGGWLVLVNEDFVIAGKEDGFIDVGAPWHEIYAQWEAEWAEEEEEW